jgi:Ca-activated chloride channel family protein
MNWGQPAALWMLLLLPAIVLLGLVRKRRRAVRYPGLSLLTALSQPAAAWRCWLLLGLRLAVLAMVIICLARPRLPDAQSRIPTQSRAILFVLDTSGSMAELDFRLPAGTSSRLEAARQAFAAFFLEDVSRPPVDDLVGIVTFAARVQDVVPPTLSHDVVRKVLHAAQPVSTPPESSTNIGDAVALGLDLLGRAPPKEKVLVLLSDGEHNVPSNVVPQALKPRQSARLAQALNVKIYTIYVGPEEPAKGDADQTRTIAEATRALEDVAGMTGGQYFAAGSTAALQEACGRIQALETSKVESHRYARHVELFPWFGLACLVLLGLRTVIEGKPWYATP